MTVAEDDADDDMVALVVIGCRDGKPEIVLNDAIFELSNVERKTLIGLLDIVIGSLNRQ
jgi:hypothetical protein